MAELPALPKQFSMNIAPHFEIATLFDHETGLTCHFTPVNGTSSDEVEAVREFFISGVNNFGYVGFSREIDNMFHVRSTYVYVTDATDIIMTGRVTPRPVGTIVPFEMGVREDGRFYSLKDQEFVVDINTYTYVRGHYERAMPLLTAGFGYCSKMFGARIAYCLFDIANKRIKRAYLSNGFVLSERFPEPVHFPSFCRKTQGRLDPVRWRVMEWDYRTIESQARIALQRYELSISVG
jgi:hypothetical protein